MGTNIACTKHIKNQHIFYMFEENDFLTMRLEPDNIHEKNAVALYFGDDKVGYIPEKDKYYTFKIKSINKTIVNIKFREIDKISHSKI